MKPPRKRKGKDIRINKKKTRKLCSSLERMIQKSINQTNITLKLLNYLIVLNIINQNVLSSQEFLKAKDFTFPEHRKTIEQ